MPQVTIIILTYNEWRETLACLESITKLNYPKVNVIIVDNKSIDGSKEKVASYIKKHPNFPAKQLLLNDNYGYAGGNNRGIELALKEGADYVLVLNPDTVVERDALTKLVQTAEHYKKDDKFAFFGPRILILNPKSKIQDPRVYSNGGIIHPLRIKATLKDYGKRAKDLNEKKPFETDYVTGTCLLASKEALKKVGLMREEYFLYYEDTDWSLRAQRAGMQCIIVPSAILWHKPSSSTKEFSYSYIYYHTRNGLFFAWWNGGLPQKAFTFVFALAKLLKQPIKALLLPKRSWTRPVTRGIIDFFLGRIGKLETEN